MKILEMNLKKGIVKVLPQSLDDLWHLYNVIREDNEVYAQTTREVRVDEFYARPKRGRRVSVFLGLRVEKVLWDRTLNRLRIHGIVCKAPEDINVTGSHHTINLTVNKPITVVKSEWLKHDVDRLERASRMKAAPLIVLSIDDEQYCVAVLRQYGVDIKVEQKTRLPGKLEPEKRTQAFKEFFKTALKFLKEEWTATHSPIVVIGPGFVKNEFANFVKDSASDVAEAVVDVKGVNSAGASGIYEALRSGVFTRALKHVRVAEEATAVEETLERLGKGRLDVTYGFAEVGKASGYGAVEKLLLADSTLREAPDEKRLVLERVMKEVEQKGGEVIIISTEHEAGAKLLALGGIAALLRFSLG